MVLLLLARWESSGIPSMWSRCYHPQGEGLPALTASPEIIIIMTFIMYNICSKSCHFTMDQAGVHIDAHDDDDHLLPLVVEAIVAHAIFWGAWTPRASSWWSSWPRSWASSPWWCSPSPCRAAGGVGCFTLWGSSWRKQESRSTSAYNHNYLLNADWWRMTMGRWDCW